MYCYHLNSPGRFKKYLSSVCQLMTLCGKACNHISTHLHLCWVLRREGTCGSTQTLQHLLSQLQLNDTYLVKRWVYKALLNVYIPCRLPLFWHCPAVHHSVCRTQTGTTVPELPQWVDLVAEAERPAWKPAPGDLQLCDYYWCPLPGTWCTIVSFPQFHHIIRSFFFSVFHSVMLSVWLILRKLFHGSHGLVRILINKKNKI